MIKFSANLGFLWRDRSLPEAIYAAKAAGFHAVECHWPYRTPMMDIAKALKETDMKMLSLNTRVGKIENGDNGIAALTGRQREARMFIDEAIEYAVAIDCIYIHVMAGFTNKDNEAQKIFCENITYACQAAADHGKSVLIEPLNIYDAPDYHISTLEDARNVLQSVGAPNLKIMFDCYHMQIMGGDLLRRFKNSIEDIGHVQFAGVPDRHEPNIGEINYVWLLNEMVASGFNGPFGAEYKPYSKTGDGLGWMKAF